MADKLIGLGVKNVYVQPLGVNWDTVPHRAPDVPVCGPNWVSMKIRTC